MKKLIYLLLIFSFVFGNKLQNVTLQLDWKYQFEFAGYIMAKEKGFYKKAGLNVKLKEFDFKNDVFNEVLNRKVNYGISSEVILKYLQNKPVVLLASFFQKSPLILITKSNIKSPKDLIGKRVMTTENFKIYIYKMLKKVGVNPKQVIFVPQTTDNIKEFKEGKIDAFSAYISDEPYDLKKENIKFNTINLSDYTYFDMRPMLFTSKYEATKYPLRTHKFLEATIKGWKYALTHKEETIKVIHKKYAPNISIDKLKYEADKIEELILPYKYTIGYLDKSYLRNQEELFDEHKKLDKLIFQFHSFILNDKEKEYLQENRVINVCTNPNWRPIEFRDEKGKPQGISIDILKILADKLNIKLNFVKTSSWVESQKFLQEKKCDVLPSAIETDKRKKYAIFTKPYLNYKLAVITTKDKPIIRNLDGIIDKTMSRKKGSGLISEMKKLYPNIKIIKTKDYLEAFKLVSDKKVYFTIATIPVLEYYKRRYGLKNLLINGYTNFKYNLRIAVRNDKPLLRDILDKSLETITPNMKKVIYERWAINVPPKPDYKKYLGIIGIIFIIAILIVLFFIYQNYYLKKRINIATKKIKEDKEKLKKLIDNAMEGIMISDENLKIIDINKRIEEIFGYTKEELIGKSLLDYVPEDEKDTINTLEPTREPVEIVRKRKDGSEVICLATRTNFIENGKKYRVSMIIDITKYKAQEEMMAQQSKAVAMGEMIGNIAHQWRQPLTALNLYIANLVLTYQFEGLDDKKLEEFEKNTDKLIQQMSQTIDDFRNFLKPDKIKKEFSLLEALNDTMKFIEASYRLNEIEIENYITNDIKVFGVKSELEQVFMNIFNNSKDAFKEKNIKNRKVIITAYKKDNKVIIKFRDNAGGVDEKILNRLTEPYFSTKFANQGTGLGLYMSEMIIRNTFNGQLIMKNVEDGLETEIILEIK